jgi:hypothetical protein
VGFSVQATSKADLKKYFLNLAQILARKTELIKILRNISCLSSSLPSHNLKVAGSNPAPATKQYNDLAAQSKAPREAVSALGPFSQPYLDDTAPKCLGAGKPWACRAV